MAAVHERHEVVAGQEDQSWFRDKIEIGDLRALLDYRSQAPAALKNHPADQHLPPLFMALGAGSSPFRAEVARW
jgi:4,5-DOPA dioxygenase extradiol